MSTFLLAMLLKPFVFLVIMLGIVKPVAWLILKYVKSERWRTLLLTRLS